jgi:hypothetical protein
MSSRLIPWWLAATGFLATLCAFTWQGDLRGPSQRVPRLAAVGRPATSSDPEQPDIQASQAPAAAEEPDNGAQPRTLPLPPTTQPEPDPDAQPVPDDAPTVDDLPTRPSQPAAPEND